MWNGPAGSKFDELTSDVLSAHAAATTQRLTAPGTAYTRHFRMEWTGRTEVSARRELVPNPSNPHLMDVADVESITLVYRAQDKPRGRWREVRYHAFSRTTRLEIGTYHDQH